MKTLTAEIQNRFTNSQKTSVKHTAKKTPKVRGNNSASKTPKRPKQYSFLPSASDVFIGPKRGTHAKTARPLTSKKPMHVCFRSRFAKGKRTMLGLNKLKVDKLVAATSARFNIKLVKYANVGNHLHLVVKLPSQGATARRHYGKWIRLLTSRLAFEVGGSKKGQPLKNEKGERTKFWDAIPFSRVIYGRRGWTTIDRYVLKNEFQSQGFAKDVATAMAQEFYESSRAHDLPKWSDEFDWQDTA